MSEWGAFRRDGTADMVALRKQALVCVRFFHELEAREEIAAKYYLGHRVREVWANGEWRVVE